MKEFSVRYFHKLVDENEIHKKCEKDSFEECRCRPAAVAPRVLKVQGTI